MECRLCGGQVSELTLKGRKYGDCPECGYLQLDAALLPDAEVERKRYLLHDNDPGEPGYRAYLSSFIDRALIPHLSPGSRVLDFGSGPIPSLAAILGEYGYDVRSWDPFFAPDSEWEDETWDAIILHEVAEHLHDPAASFRKIAPRVRKGGIVAVRSRFRPESPSDLESWWYLRDFTHVGFFSPRSFATIALFAGFSLILCMEPDTVVLKSVACLRSLRTEDIVR
jgi:hypothetical protein